MYILILTLITLGNKQSTSTESIEFNTLETCIKASMRQKDMYATYGNIYVMTACVKK